HSMALLADGWHMGTHVMAFMIAIFAYRYSRIHQQDQTFAFSPAKVGILGGFASSIALAMVALMMVAQSAERILFPQAIRFDEATIVAIAGLVINLLSALLLRDQHDHSHHHHHNHGHDHHEHHHDHNLRAAYLHVIADAMTSVLAIIALLAGKYYGWDWLDTVMGFVGAVVILIWAWGLIKETSPILLDQSVGDDFERLIRQVIEEDGEAKIVDLHVWRLTAGHCAAIISLVSQTPKSPSYYKGLLTDLVDIDHLTIEINTCVGDDCRIV
ncbi:MAG: CDF family Co(II)/Ni(II) efflux transporter DmeF, partial [Methylomonas sp.]